jgi:hypothetical protein
MENYTPMWQVPTCEPKPIELGVTGITWSAITVVYLEVHSVKAILEDQRRYGSREVMGYRSISRCDYS